MRVKLLLLVAALIFSATMAMAQPNVPILEVDTLAYLGKGVAGEAGGALFLPDGNIIALWKGRPLIIDSKSGEIIRNLDALPSGFAAAPKLSPDGTKLITRITESQMAIWDVPSGKIVKQFNYQIGWFCFSPDGTKLYVTLPNLADNLGHLVVYDMVTFQEIERISYPELTWADKIDISPDGQTLAVLVGKKKDGQADNKTRQLILINLKDKKNYTVVETAEPELESIEFSPDGKRIASHYNNSNGLNYIYIYNLETKEKKVLTEESLETIFGYNSLLSGHPKFIDNNILSFIFSKYTLIWNIEENQLKKIINFLPLSIIPNDDTLLLCNQRGVIAYISKKAVSIGENPLVHEDYLTCSNNQLEYYSDKDFVAKIIVYDTTGKLIVDLGSQQFITGKNTIPINKPLNIGIYILTIDTGSEPLSYKFIVE